MHFDSPADLPQSLVISEPRSLGVLSPSVQKAQCIMLVLNQNIMTQCVWGFDTEPSARRVGSRLAGSSKKMPKRTFWTLKPPRSQRFRFKRRLSRRHSASKKVPLSLNQCASMPLV